MKKRIHQNFTAELIHTYEEKKLYQKQEIVLI